MFGVTLPGLSGPQSLLLIIEPGEVADAALLGSGRGRVALRVRDPETTCLVCLVCPWELAKVGREPRSREVPRQTRLRPHALCPREGNGLRLWGAARKGAGGRGSPPE